MMTIKTVSPQPNRFIRFLKHDGFTFKMTYHAIFKTDKPEVAPQAELFTSAVLSDNGWVDVVTNEDLVVDDFDIKDYGNSHPHSISKIRSDVFFIEALNHIEMLYSQEKSNSII